jgi:hypothetical protein
MKNKILGAIGILWGGAIVVRWFLTSTADSGNVAYQAGQGIAVVLGGLMLAAGLYYFFKKS